MKSGISLVEMAQEIQRQNDLKADYMLDTRSLRLEPFGGGLYLNAYDQSGDYAVEPLEVNAIAHRQIGTHLKIPAAYYDKMLEEYPELLAQNVNAWFQREPAVRMVRTIDGTARAFLSNRYRRIDNLDIAGIVLPVLQEMEGMHFESCQLTDSRMYIKVVNTRLEAEVVPGDIVQSGIIISNSEVGLGSVSMAVWSRSASRKIATAAMITALQLSAFCVISRGKSWPRSAPMPMSSRGKSKLSTFSGR